MRIVIDAMGSDAYPVPDVEGGVMAAKAFTDCTIILVGDEKRIREELAKHASSGLAIEVVHASEVIEMTDSPAQASKAKKDSSMHVGMRLVKNGEADAFVSAGNTGGILSVATLHTLKRIRGVSRPALGVVFPIKERPFLIDSGTNTDCKPDYLLQFAVMGSLYVQKVLDIEKPSVGLISNGEEEGKGNSLVKETHALLSQSGLHYIGNIEPKEFINGKADVAVTDGFTGNMIMKTTEATARYFSDSIRDSMMKNPLTILGGLLARPAFRKVRQQTDPNEVGGAPLLGVNGPVIIGHGSSNAYAIKQAVGQARKMVEQEVVEAIRAGI